MGKYKCEYISEKTNKRELSMITEVDQVLDIIQLADCSKDIKVFQKKNTWQLVYHVKEGKTILNNMFKNFKDENKEQNKYKPIQSKNLAKKITNAFNACPSRVKTQSFIDIVFDSVFMKEDVSKPKLKILSNKRNNNIV